MISVVAVIWVTRRFCCSRELLRVDAVASSLQREGYEVKAFPDGGEALHWLTSPDGRVPALVVLDVEMPKLNGFEVAMRLKRLPRLAQTVVVLMSRRDGVVDRLKGRLAGCKEFLPKPFTVQALVQVVTQFLGPSPASMSSEKR